MVKGTFNQTKVKLFRRCQKAYSFRYDYGERYLGPKGRTREMVRKVPKVQLKRGSWMHSLQEAHHRTWAVESGFDELEVWDEAEDEETGEAFINRRPWTVVHKELSKEFRNLFEEEREELGDLPSECKRLFKSYLAYWQDDAERYTVAPLEDGSPAIEFILEVNIPHSRAVFKGRVDLLVEDMEYGGLWIWDHKWVKTVPAPDERMMSPQALMYFWALRELGYDVRGFVYNYGRTKAPTIPRVLKRPAGTLSVAHKMDTDLPTYIRAMKDLHGEDWKKYARTIYREKLQELKGREGLWFRREPIPIDTDRMILAYDEYITTIADIEERDLESPPRSYFYNCKFSCDYHDICCAEFQGLNIDPMVKKQYRFEGERYGEEENDLLQA